MIINILDWTGTFLILVGSFLITSKLAKEAKWRKYALFCYFLSNILWIPMAFLLGAYGLTVTQFILFFINIRGVYINHKEDKNIIE